MENLIREDDNTSILNKFNLHDELKESYIDLANKRNVLLDREIRELRRDKLLNLITPKKTIEKSITKNRNSSYSKENTQNKLNKKVNCYNNTRRGSSEIDLKLRNDQLNNSTIKKDSQPSNYKTDIKVIQPSPSVENKTNKEKQTPLAQTSVKASSRRKTEPNPQDQDFGKKALLFESSYSIKDEAADKKGKVASKPKETPQEKYLKLLKKIRSNIKKQA